MSQLFTRVIRKTLEYLLEFLVKQVGSEATFQVVYEAVNQNTSSEQAEQLYLAFRVVVDVQKQREQAYYSCR